MKTVFRFIPIPWLIPSRYQPRVDFEQRTLQELAKSIATQGLIEPLIVRELAKERYEIIAGERRWRAAQIAGLNELPCLLGDYTDVQAAALALVENIQRKDLNLIEEATGYRRLLDEFHFQQEEIATLVAKSRSHIANLLRLLTLSKPLQQRLRAGSLSLGHARMLVGLDEKEQLFFAEKIEAHQWSVRALEKKIREIKQQEQPVKTDLKKDRDIDRLQVQLAEQMGAPVQIISDNESGGWLQVKFYDNDTLAGLLERMGLRYD